LPVNDETTAMGDQSIPVLKTEDELRVYLGRNQEATADCLTDASILCRRLVALCGTGLDLVKLVSRCAAEDMDRTPAQGRGKRFEGIVFEELKRVFGESWEVEDTSGSASSMDIVMTHRKTGAKVGVECKCVKTAVPMKEVDKFNADKIAQGYSAAVFISRSRIPGKTSPVHVLNEFNEVFVSNALNIGVAVARVQAVLETMFMGGVLVSDANVAVINGEAIKALESAKRRADDIAQSTGALYKCIKTFTDKHPTAVHEDVRTQKWSIRERRSTGSASAPQAAQKEPAKQPPPQKEAAKQRAPQKDHVKQKAKETPVSPSRASFSS
jgi:hypothetical protein